MAKSGLATGDYRDVFADASNAFVREVQLPRIPVPFVPVKVSNDFSISELEKPTAVFLFREDYAPDNRIQFGGKFKGRWTVKANAAMKIEGSTHEPRLFMSDDLQINGPIAGTNLQLKFRPEVLSAQLDFGHTLVQNDYDTAQGALRINHFINPYLYFESDRSFHNQLYGVGAMYYLNNLARKNFRLNFYKRENVLNWNFQLNSLYSYGGFFLNTLFTLTYNDFFAMQNRRLMLGYDENDVNANVEFNFEGGSVKKWSLSDVTATAAYNMREKGLFGLFLRSFFLHTQSTPVTDFGVGYSNRLNKDFDVKAKLSLNGVLNLFMNYKLQEGLYLQPSLMTSLLSQSKRGFLNFPFDFGLKVKLER